MVEYNMVLLMKNMLGDIFAPYGPVSPIIFKCLVIKKWRCQHIHERFSSSMKHQLCKDMHVLVNTGTILSSSFLTICYLLFDIYAYITNIL